MEKTLMILGLCCLAVALGNPILSGPPGQLDEIYEINELIGKTTERQHRVVSNCPSAKSCMKDCPLGYERDAMGCPICNQCKTEGNYESDIVIDSRSYKQFKNQFGAAESCEEEKLSRGAQANANQQWPSTGGQVIVPYTFHSSITTSRRTNIMKGIALYHANTCIRFVPRSNQANYIEFMSTSGCQSYVGMIGGKQNVWISDGCDRKIGTILHELMHALGFWHEQSRGDRDNYVTIKWDNIVDSFKDNFRKQDASKWNSYGSQYDLGSVMHYGGYFFSKQYNVLPTIVDKSGKPVVSQRNGFSTEDLKQINAKYQCTGVVGTTQPPATTTTTPRPTTTVPGGCADQLKKSDCDWYKSNNYCITSTQVRDQFCSLTCGVCTAGTTPPPTTTTVATTTTTTTTTKSTGTGNCGDNSEYCPQWSNSGHCSDSFKGYMEANCKLSCGLCVTAAPATTKPSVTNPTGKKCVDVYKQSSCKHWEALGYCQNTHVTFMKKNCNLTCGLCTSGSITTTLAPECSDLHKSCSKWVALKYCTQNYVSYMTKNCRKSCGFCGTKVTTATPSPTVAPVVYNGECGVPDETLNYRIVGGVTAIYKASPWIVSIRQANGQDLCGGSLISNRFMVTAAHCFGGTKDPTEGLYYALLGKYHVSQNVKDRGEKRVNFKHITVHPAYNHYDSDNDIAVIEFTEYVAYTDYIRPVCLPPRYEEPRVNTVALVTGWGDTKSPTQTNDVLLQVDVTIIDKTTCNLWMQQQSGKAAEVTNNMFCAGVQQGGKDACQGDSGGPLVQQSNGKHILKGIVSWGYGCAKKERPGVYTKVSNKVDWINGIMEA